MADICDTCDFEDACPSAHFNKTEAPMTDEAVEMVMEKLEALKDGKGD